MGGMKLYEAAEALAIVEELIEEHAELIAAAGGDLMAVPEIAELLEQAEGDFKKKAQNVALFILDVEARSAASAAEAKRLRARAASLEAKADGLKRFYLLRQMQAAGFTKLECELVNIRRQMNSQPTVRSVPQVRPGDHPDSVAVCAPFVKTVPAVPAVPEQLVWDVDAAKAAVMAHRRAVREEETAARKEKRPSVAIQPPVLPTGFVIEYDEHLRIN